MEEDHVGMPRQNISSTDQLILTNFSFSSDSGVCSGSGKSLSSSTDTLNNSMDLAEKQYANQFLKKQNEGKVRDYDDFYLSSALSSNVCVEKFASHLVDKIFKEAFHMACQATWSIECSADCHPKAASTPPSLSAIDVPKLCWTPEIFSTPKRENSIKSRLSVSHSSLVSASPQDDSSFISGALSYSTLTPNVDLVPKHSFKKSLEDFSSGSMSTHKRQRRKKRNSFNSRCLTNDENCNRVTTYKSASLSDMKKSRPKSYSLTQTKNNFENILSPTTSQSECSSVIKTFAGSEPIHMTLDEVRVSHSKRRVRESCSSDNLDCLPNSHSKNKNSRAGNVIRFFKGQRVKSTPIYDINICDNDKVRGSHSSFPRTIKQTVNNLLKLYKTSHKNNEKPTYKDNNHNKIRTYKKQDSITSRELPPVPTSPTENNLPAAVEDWDGREFASVPEEVDQQLLSRSPIGSNSATDFAASIEKVKDVSIISCKTA